MKVLLVNGSSKPDGCTYTALNEIAVTLEKEGIESEIFFLGNDSVRDCVGCGACSKLSGKCVYDNDIVNRLIEKAAEADGFVFGSPVYYAHPSGRILSVLDRAFYAGKYAFAHKPGAAIVSARRGGTTASFDVLNKYFTISEMPVVASSYWNMVHGSFANDVIKDEEGLQTMRNIATNMAWLLKCIEAGKEKGINIPDTDKSARTNFIR
jgi:multimeric flavodoxin WrbA